MPMPPGPSSTQTACRRVNAARITRCSSARPRTTPVPGEVETVRPGVRLLVDALVRALCGRRPVGSTSRARKRCHRAAHRRPATDQPPVHAVAAYDGRTRWRGYWQVGRHRWPRPAARSCDRSGRTDPELEQAAPQTVPLWTPRSGRPPAQHHSHAHPPHLSVAVPHHSTFVDQR